MEERIERAVEKILKQKSILVEIDDDELEFGVIDKLDELNLAYHKYFNQDWFTRKKYIKISIE